MKYYQRACPNCGTLAPIMTIVGYETKGTNTEINFACNRCGRADVKTVYSDEYLKKIGVNRDSLQENIE